MNRAPQPALAHSQRAGRLHGSISDRMTVAEGRSTPSRVVAPNPPAKQGGSPSAKHLLPSIPNKGSANTVPITGISTRLEVAGGTPLAAGASATSAPPAYTGASLLAGYTSRRKIMQKAAALATRMRTQVQDVVQMEEEQRLLSLAFRDEDKLLGEEGGSKQQSAQTKSRSPNDAATKTPRDALDSVNTKKRNAEGSPGQPSNLSSSTASLGMTTAAPGDHSPTLAEEGETGMVLRGDFDIRRHLEQQQLEKMETLSKMRSLQQAIQQLSEEAAAEEEHQQAQRRREPSTSGVDLFTLEGGTEGGPPHSLPISPQTNTKLEAIEEMQAALREMLSVNHAPYLVGFSGGVTGSKVNPAAITTQGLLWLEQDATYTPPPPPQVFSTNAFAITLEYLSNSIACVARVADEVCVATTFHARTEAVQMQQHFTSLEKWMAQVERCLDTAQRHFRHFQLGETAVQEGGAFELNSLREQTLLLKESLTAQEQKVKATEESKASALHRLSEIRRRCFLWEFHLLHYNGGRWDRAQSFLGGDSVNSTVATATVALQGVQSTVPDDLLVSLAPETPSLEPFLSSSGGQRPLFQVIPSSESHEAQGFSRYRSDASLGERSSEATRASSTSLWHYLKGSTKNAAATAGSAPTQSVSATKGAPSEAPISAYVRAHQPPTEASLDLIEQRVARSWCNPYVRKQQLRERSEQVTVLRQQQAQLQQQRATEARTSTGVINPPPNPVDEGDDMCLVTEKTQISPSCLPESFERTSPQPPSVATSYLEPTLASTGFRVSFVNSPEHLPGLVGRESSFGESRRNTSRAFSAVAMAGSAVAMEELVGELADTRMLQLLQSLLRSMPSSSKDTASHESTQERQRDDASQVTKAQASSDVVHDKEVRIATRHSVQRLVRFLTKSTTTLSPSRLNASAKQ